MVTQNDGDRTRPVVAIPARDEAASIGACLGALGQQTCLPMAVVLLLNNCSDATEEVAKAIALPFYLDVHSVSLPAQDANAGTARRLAMDRAAQLAGRDGLLMTTDADAIVPPDWVALNMDALAAEADVVCGRALIDPQDATAIPVHLHADDALECEYADLLDAITEALCPDIADPRPRHTEASGASIALTVNAFLQAGGVPRVATGEDRALIAALKRIDARVRHDPKVCVIVSGRTIGRAAGGTADTIRRRLIQQDVFTDAGLEPPGDAVRRADFRQRLRKMWSGGGIDADLAADLHIPSAALDACLQEKFFGCSWDTVEHLSPMLPRRRVRFADLPKQIELARELLCLLEHKHQDRMDRSLPVKR